MNHRLGSFAGICLIALAACSSAPRRNPPNTPAMISPAAQQALIQAGIDVQAAQDRFALWTTAASAYQAALEAAKSGKSDVVMQQASFASSQAKLGIAQLAYPTTEPKP